MAHPHGYEENKGTDSLNENVRHVQNENIAMTFCKFCDKFSNLPNNDCCENKVHEGENYMNNPVKDNSIHESMNTVKIVTNIKIQDLPKLVLIESENVMEINTTGDDNPKNDPLGEEILPKIEKSDNFKEEEEDFESKTILVPNILNAIYEDHNYI